MVNFIKKRWYVVLIVAVVATVIFFQYKNAADSAEKKQDSYKVVRDNFQETLTLSGEIDAAEKVSLRFQTSGRLSWVGVKEGDSVKKNQTIASLDSRELKNRLTKYLNTYAVSRNNFEETKDDNWNKQFDLSSDVRREAERVLENNQYNLQNAVLDVEYQNISVQYSYLWTPIAGIVTRVDTPYAGINVTPAGSEFQIINPETIYLSVTAEQSDVILLKKGMTGEITFDAFPDKTYNGEVDYISYIPKSGESGTVYQVRINLNDAAHLLPLKLAMTGDVTFTVSEKKNVIAVPIRYMNNDEKGDYVNLERKGKKEKIYVVRGEEVDDFVVIKSGLNVGDIVYD